MDSESAKRVVAADTGPIRYLYLIGYIDLLPTLFRQVHIPAVVFGEMVHGGAPSSLRQWVLGRPAWLLVEPEKELEDPATGFLDDGERAAISLASRIVANLVLMDDRRGVRFAKGIGFEVIGTLGVLDLAARRGHIDLERAFDALKATNFRYRPQILPDMLAEDRLRR